MPGRISCRVSADDASRACCSTSAACPAYSCSNKRSWNRSASRHPVVARVEEGLEFVAGEAEGVARLRGDAGEGLGEEEAIVKLARAERDLTRLGVHDGGLYVDGRRRRADLPAELAPGVKRLEEVYGELVVGPRVLPVVPHLGGEVELVAGERGAVTVEGGGRRRGRS